MNYSIALSIAMALSALNLPAQRFPLRATPLETATAKHRAGMTVTAWWEALNAAEREAVQVNYYLNESPGH